MKIAVFGGNFDPPHIGHLLAAQAIKKFLNIDQIWILPFHKTLPITSNHHRLAMSRLIENDFLKISAVGIEKQTDNPEEILEHLRNSYPDHSFYWMSSADKIHELVLLANAKTVLTEKCILYSGENTKNHIEKQIQHLTGWEHIPHTMFIIASDDFPVVHVSSPYIREKIQKNESIRGLLPKAIEGYILSHNLYH